MHRSWGFGRIRTVDTVFARFTIDFSSKPGHTMDLAFAAASLKPISKEHVLARKAADPGQLREMAVTAPKELIKLVLTSFGGQATADQIQQILVPDVIGEDWKKWWEATKRELKKDGHFKVPGKKAEPVIYEVKEVSLESRLLGDFKAAKGLKARLVVAAELLKNLGDIADKQATAREVIDLLNGEVGSYQRTQPSVALEAIFIRDELKQEAGLEATPGEIEHMAIWSEEADLGGILEALPAARHRKALESFKLAHPADWSEILMGSLNSISAKLAREIASVLIHEGKLEELKETLARRISQHTASTELLLWLARDRNDSFADILGPEVFRAMLTAMERDQFNEKRSNKLRDFILDDQQLLVELIGSADLEVIKDLTRALQYSPSFDDMDKRSLLARIVKSYPAIQSLITGDQPRQETYLVVSWESLERRKNEYHELVQKKIPANSKEIAIARSYGDLRENHEYKAAKEMQKLLMRRKAELETQLVRARGTDFANPQTNVVSIGTTVQAIDLETGEREHFSILGAWDSDPAQGVVSYLSPVAQALMNRAVGDEVEFEVHGVQHHHRIDTISACQRSMPAEVVSEASALAAEPSGIEAKPAAGTA